MLKRSPSRAALVLGLALLLAPAAARAQDATEYGPSKGTLLIVGGGSLKDSGIPEKFIELAGGKDAKIVVVPTAGGNKNADGSLKVYTEEAALKSWRARGLIGRRGRKSCRRNGLGFGLGIEGRHHGLRAAKEFSTLSPPFLAILRHIMPKSR